MGVVWVLYEREPPRSVDRRLLRSLRVAAACRAPQRGLTRWEKTTDTHTTGPALARSMR